MSWNTRTDVDGRGAVTAAAPKEGEILEGEIVRIEKYGAFCSLLSPLGSSGRWQGLIHISQLHESRVDRVEDVVSLNDRVWVKVLQVEFSQQQQQQLQQHGDGFNSGTNNSHRPRIKLSMKDCSQDGSCQDFGRQREQMEHAKSQLETNLNSMIGMAVARDPMENRLVFKGGGATATTASKTTFRGGYTLVGDDEGEPPEPEPSNNPPSLATDNNTGGRQLALAPMGRGRGATLPAWMTTGGGPGGVNKNNAPEMGRNKNDGENSDRDTNCDYDGKKKRRRHKKSPKKEKKKRKKYRKRGRYEDNSADDSSRSSREDDHPKRKRREMEKKNRHDDHQPKSRHYRSRRSSSNDSRRKRRENSGSESETEESIGSGRHNRGDRPRRKHSRRRRQDRSVSSGSQ
jgi:predicted RNA-binding protein with RPS1 domain